MVSKKDFKAVAEIINEITEDDVFTTTDDFRQTISKRLADYFATQNSRFDRERFMKACGLD